MLTQKTYPELYLSEKVRELLQELPPLPEPPIEPKEPVKPIEPHKSEVGYGIGGALFGIIGAIVLIVIFSQKEINWEVISPGIVVIVLMLFMLYFSFISKKSDNKEIEEYNQSISDYQRLMEIFKQKKEQYQVDLLNYNNSVRAIRSNRNITKYRKKLIEKWENTRECPVIMDCDESDAIKRGAAEDFFFQYLSDEFIAVKRDKKVPVGSKYYYPDFILFSDFYIDIEIDEPYTGTNGIPIHYLDNRDGVLLSIDAERNTFMTKNGWEVIRFSEEQVFLHPEECINYINAVIDAVYSGKMPKIPVNSDFSCTKYTKEQASQLALVDFRNTYIPLLDDVDDED